MDREGWSARTCDCYFFFFGFLVSFLGLLSLAIENPPLHKDYTRMFEESPRK